MSCRHWLSLILLIGPLVLVSATRASDESVSWEVYAEGIVLTQASGSFVAAHITKAGDTFESLSREFYGEPSVAELLAQVAGMPVDTVFEAGATVHMIESSFEVPFASDERAVQLNETLACAERMGEQPIRVLWDATIPMFGSTTRQVSVSMLKLKATDDSNVQLEISFAGGTSMTSVLKSLTPPTKVRCLTPK